MFELIKNIWLIFLAILDTAFQTKMLDHPLLSAIGLPGTIAALLIGARKIIKITDTYASDDRSTYQYRKTNGRKGKDHNQDQNQQQKKQEQKDKPQIEGENRAN